MIYDLDKLKDELKNIEADIEQIEQIKQERLKKREEYLQLIAGSEAILEMHKNGSQN